MNSIVSKGKTVKAAVSTALELLDAKKSDVDVEVIEMEYKGILGIGSRPAIVRVTLKSTQIEEAPAPLEEHPMDVLQKAIQDLDTTALDMEDLLPTREPIPDELAGKVWVKDGHIFCKEAPDKYPMVIPKKGMKFTKNGLLIEKTVVVLETDNLSVELEDEVQDPKWEIKVSNDKMEARLEVIPGFRIFRTLKDKDPNSFVELEVSERKNLNPLETGAVIEKMGELGITFGLDYMEIARACQAEEHGAFIVARGVAPIPGNHGHFVPAQELEIKKGIKERTDGRVDYREIQEFPSVERGQVIGVIQPPVPGRPGTSIFGESVSPPEVYQLLITEGRGIALVDETVIVATEPGQPEIKSKGRMAKICVIPKLTIPHDVTMKSGNVHYAGDVDVLGTIQDNMLVEAQGNILVQGNANMAKIQAGNSVIIRKNAITCEVVAGKSSMLVQELNQILGEMYEQLGHMMLAIQQIMKISAFKMQNVTRTGLGPLIKILCDGKFKSFPTLASSLTNKMKTAPNVLDQEWLELGDSLYRNFVTPHLATLRDTSDLHALLKRVEMTYKTSTIEEEESDCFVQANYVQNSQVYSTGEIQVLGEGVYNSKLYAKGTIRISGFVRGGDIYADKGIQIGEAGTKGGIPTEIRVPMGHTIIINRALVDTVIQIGPHKHTFLRETHFVRARVNDDGVLTIQ